MEKRGESFSDSCWSFTNGKVVKGDGKTVVASNELSERISKDLKKRGFKFCGPTITYAWLQAVGIVNVTGSTGEELSPVVGEVRVVDARIEIRQ